MNRVGTITIALLLLAACAKKERSSRIDEQAVITNAPADLPPPADSARVILVPKDDRLRGDVNIGKVALDAPVPDAELVVNSFRGDFSKCYETELRSNPATTGRLEIVLVLEATGAVVSVTPRATGLSEDLTECIVKGLRTARFPSWAGRRATLRVPVSLTPARTAAK